MSTQNSTKSQYNDFERFGIDTKRFQTYADKVAGAKSTGGTLTYEVGQDQKGIYGSSSAMTGTNANTVRAMLRIFDQYKSKSGNKNVTPKIQVSYGNNSNQFDLVVDGKSVGKFTNTKEGMNEAGQALINRFNTDYGSLEDVTPDGPPTYKPGDPNTLTYNYTGGISMGEGGESVTVPLGLYDSPPPGGTQNVYSSVMPNQGYKFGYDDQGFRYQVPEDYDFSAATTPKPGVIFGPEPNFVPTGSDITNVPDDLANEMGVETFDTTGNTNMADNFGTASDAAKTVLEGGAAPQQITYGATLTPQDDRQIIDTEGKFVDGTISPTAAQATVSQATMPDQFGVAQATTQTTVGGVEDVVANTQAATGTVSQTMDAATKDPYSTAVSGAPGAAQISQPTRVEAPEPLAVTPEMLVSGVADARVASAFAEEVQAAQAQPSEKATVQGQLVNLMAQFEEGDTPAWAAGAMRQATAMMAQRGMSASSLAGQAIVQAAMESALPIAQADAQTQAQFESQNLSNRQQRAMLAAQQRAQFIGQEFDQAFQARVQNAARVADIAGINFNAQQQIALENARIANSVDLANLNNKQARIMAEVAQIASLESQNLNNRQQAAQQNAQAFLQMDMANLSNEQQTELFKSQSKIQALFTDAAAENAASQFNASSQNQVNQFFANLFSQTSQFNATQENAISQFNADQRNVITRFTEEINNQREQFNASNRLVIDQANANWFRNVATADTAAINFANNQSVGNLLAFTTTSLNNMYQAERDMIEQAWTSGENDLERATDIILQRIVGEIELAVADKESSAKDSNTIGQWIRDIIGWM